MIRRLVFGNESPMADSISALFQRIAEHIEASDELSVAARKNKSLSDLLISISRDKIAYSKDQIVRDRSRQILLYNYPDTLASPQIACSV